MKGTKVAREKVYQLRDEGLNQAEIAQRLGISKRTVIRYLQAKLEPLEMALKAIPQERFLALFTSFRTLINREAVCLFLLKKLNHPTPVRHAICAIMMD